MPLYSRNTKQWVKVEAVAAPTFRTATYNGERFVGGELAQEYQIEISNGDPRSRALAVVTVDGRNVIDASVGSASGPGYVLGPNENQAIKGWRTSNDEIAAFVLTRGGDSYSSRTFEDSNNIGVIGVAFFAEEKVERDVYRGGGRRQASASKGTTRSAGTGFGARQQSHVTSTTFERAGAPEVHVIRYDVTSSLIALGIMQAEIHFPANPFPADSGNFCPTPG